MVAVDGVPRDFRHRRRRRRFYRSWSKYIGPTKSWFAVISTCFQGKKMSNKLPTRPILFYYFACAFATNPWAKTYPLYYIVIHINTFSSLRLANVAEHISRTCKPNFVWRWSGFEIIYEIRCTINCCHNVAFINVWQNKLAKVNANSQEF